MSETPGAAEQPSPYLPPTRASSPTPVEPAQAPVAPPVPPYPTAQAPQYAGGYPAPGHAASGYPTASYPAPGYPAPGYYPPQAAQTPSNGLGTAGMVCGIVSIALCWTILVGGVLGILGVIFGSIGKARAKRGAATNGGMALAGIITGAIGIVAAIVIIVAVVVNSLNDFGTV